MAPKKYYAVAKGRRPGIYDNWLEAKMQIDGFNGAVYKGFPSKKEAEDWMKRQGVVSPARLSAMFLPGVDTV